jgi:hypothetical protein
MGSFSKTLFTVSFCAVIVLVGLVVFPPFHQIFNSIMPTNSSPLVAGFLTVCKYSLFVAIFYGAVRMWQSHKGQTK